METRISKILSIIFQPLLIPTYMLFLVFNLNSYIAFLLPFEARRLILITVSLLTFVLPISIIFMMVRHGMIQSVHLEEREERIFPLIITGILYYVTYFLMSRLNLDPIYLRLFMGSTVAIILAMIINFVWKISIHMIGMGGMLGGILGIGFILQLDLIIPALITTLLCGMVGSARLHLNAHKPLQVYTGFLLGFFVMILMFLY